MDTDILLDDKNVIVMKLLHYFITEKNYNPIILQGVDNEIWLENLNEDYKVVRIVSEHIHNDEQFDFDIFKTKRIIKKIKRKTLSFNMNVLSIFLNLGDNVTKDLTANKNALCIKIDSEKDFSKDNNLKTIFPDLTKKLNYKEDGVELFAKITSDINNHNKEDAKKMEKVFSSKKPTITYALIIINVLLYFIPLLLGFHDELVSKYCIFAPSIRNGEYYRLLTGAFIHANILHLGCNCYALYVLGTQLESYLGKIKYTVIYILSAISASLFSMIFAKNTASVGASGAIFGIMGALLCFGYYYRVYLGNVLKSQIIPLIIFNLILGFTLSGIDNFAHIGGLLGGIGVTMALGVDGKSKKYEIVNGIVITTIFIAFEIYMAFIYGA